MPSSRTDIIVVVVVVGARRSWIYVSLVMQSSRTDPNDDVVDVTSFTALDVVEIKVSLAMQGDAQTTASTTMTTTTKLLGVSQNCIHQK